jgi:hypothetical protein
MAESNDHHREPAKPTKWLLRALDEIGILPVIQSPWDTKLLMASLFAIVPRHMQVQK